MLVGLWPNLYLNILVLLLLKDVLCLSMLKDLIRDISQGKPGAAGIVGLLKDHNSSILAIFSMPIGMANANEAEFVAIKQAFYVFGASIWASSLSLVIEADSVIALKWTCQPRTTPFGG